MTDNSVPVLDSVQWLHWAACFRDTARLVTEKRRTIVTANSVDLRVNEVVIVPARLVSCSPCIRGVCPVGTARRNYACRNGQCWPDHHTWCKRFLLRSVPSKDPQLGKFNLRSDRGGIAHDHSCLATRALEYYLYYYSYQPDIVYEKVSAFPLLP